jgi:hypothetical protein
MSSDEESGKWQTLFKKNFLFIYYTGTFTPYSSSRYPTALSNTATAALSHSISKPRSVPNPVCMSNSSSSSPIEDEEDEDEEDEEEDEEEEEEVFVSSDIDS